MLALFACLGFQGFILAGVKSLLGGLVGPVGFYLSPVLFGYLLVLLLSGSHRPVGLRSLAACLFVVAVSAIAHLCGKRRLYPVALPWWVSCSAPAEPEPVAASWEDSREFCLSWP